MRRFNPLSSIPAISAGLLLICSLSGELPIRTGQLSNGLQIIVVEDQNAPVISVGLFMKGGSMAEPLGQNGVARLHEHLFLKAVDVETDTLLRRVRLSRMGVSWSSATYAEMIAFRLIVHPDSLRPLLSFLYQIIDYPLSDTKVINREKRVLLETINLEKINPQHELQAALLRLLWGTAFPMMNPSGDGRSIFAVTPDQLRLQHVRFAIPNTAALVVAGDVVASELRDLTSLSIGRWLQGVAPSDYTDMVQLPKLAASGTAVLRRDIKGAHLLAGWQVAGLSEPPAAAQADLFCRWMNGPTSPLRAALTGTGALLHFEYDAFRSSGVIRMELEAAPSDFQGAVKIIAAQLQNASAESYWRSRNFEQFANLLHAQESRANENPDKYVAEIGRFWAGEGLAYYTSRWPLMAAVTPAEMQQFVQTQIVSAPRIVVIMASSKMINRHGLSTGPLMR